MKTTIYYYSKYGNTRRLAEAMAETARQAGEAQATHISELTAAALEEADLIVMGSPTHIQNVPKEVRAILDPLPKGLLRGKPAAAFDTSLKMWGPLMRMTAGPRLGKRLRKLGAKLAVKPETFLVAGGDSTATGEQDLLNDGELARARDWMASILRSQGAL